MNSQHRFPKPQHPEYLPEQAGAFPKPCPSQPISQRHSVPQLYPGKCSLSPGLPVLSRTTAPAGARQPHGASLPCESGKEASCIFREAQAGFQGPERVPNHAHCFHQAMPDTGKPASCTIHICGWENVQKTQEQSEGKEQRVQPRLGQASLRRQISGPGTSRLRHSH